MNIVLGHTIRIT